MIDINERVKDGVVELTNMICDDAKRRLFSEGILLETGIPTVIMEKNHSTSHIANGPCLAVPFDTEWGEFIVEVALTA